MMGQQLHEIVTPHDHDVLSGRGNFVNYHAGNEHFRSLVRKHKVAYVACPKQQKGKFSRMIVEEIRARNPPGRFLKQDPVTKLWHDIGEKKALDKTRQALREGAPEIMKEINGDEEPAPSSPKADNVESNQNSGESAPEKSPPPPDKQPSAAPVLSGSDIGSNHVPNNNNNLQRDNRPQQMGGDGFGNVGGGSQFEAGFNNGVGNGDLPPMPTSSQFAMQSQQQQMPGDMMGHQNGGGRGGFQQQGNMVSGSGGGAGGFASNGMAQNNMGATPGLGTIADLRARMQQQHQQQRQFGVFNTGNPNPQSVGSGMSSGQSLQQKLASLAQLQQDMYQQQQQLQQQQEALMNQQNNAGAAPTFEFEPRPIAPGNEANVLPPVRSMGIESNQAPKSRGVDRQASEKSLEMDHLFDKAIHGPEPDEKDKMGASNASAMSISLGDIGADLDDPSSMKPPPNRTFNLQEQRSAEQQNPDDLAERFNSSMKIKQQGQQQGPKEVGGSGGFDMSVGTLGDSGNLFGNSNASMAFSEGSFGDIFDDNEKESIVA